MSENREKVDIFNKVRTERAHRGRRKQMSEMIDGLFPVRLFFFFKLKLKVLQRERVSETSIYSFKIELTPALLASFLM